MTCNSTLHFGINVPLDKIRDLTPNFFATDFDFQIAPARGELRGIVTPSCRDTKISSYQIPGGSKSFNDLFY
jgi:hypothetical protein